MFEFLLIFFFCFFLSFVYSLSLYRFDDTTQHLSMKNQFGFVFCCFHDKIRRSYIYILYFIYYTTYRYRHTQRFCGNALSTTTDGFRSTTTISVNSKFIHFVSYMKARWRALPHSHASQKSSGKKLGPLELSDAVKEIEEKTTKNDDKNGRARERERKRSQWFLYMVRYIYIVSIGYGVHRF